LSGVFIAVVDELIGLLRLRHSVAPDWFGYPVLSEFFGTAKISFLHEGLSNSLCCLSSMRSLSAIETYIYPDIRASRF
jgi:hypothetical protein